MSCLKSYYKKFKGYEIMKIDIKRVLVKFNNKIVGYLQELDNKQIAFQYDDEWLRNGFSIFRFLCH